MKADVYCEICEGYGSYKGPDCETTDCESCVGTGRSPVPFAELFKDGRMHHVTRDWEGKVIPGLNVTVSPVRGQRLSRMMPEVK